MGGVGWGGVLLDYSVSPSPNPFPLEFAFGIWDLDLGPEFGIGLGLDNYKGEMKAILENIISRAIEHPQSSLEM